MRGAITTGRAGARDGDAGSSGGVVRGPFSTPSRGHIWVEARLEVLR